MKEISRRRFFELLFWTFVGSKISGCAEKEAPTPTLTQDEFLETLSRDKLFEWAVDCEGIGYSEQERNLWLTEISIDKWDPDDPESQRIIAEKRLKSLFTDRMVISQNPYFKESMYFLAENVSKIEFVVQRPEETEVEISRVVPSLSQEGKIVYVIEFALPGLRSNIGEEGGLKDLDLALEIVHQFAFIEYLQNLEREGRNCGLVGIKLLDFVSKPYNEFDACADSLAFAYGKSTMSYFYAIGLTNMRKYGSLTEDLLEVLIRNNLDFESSEWGKEVVKRTNSCLPGELIAQKQTS